MYEPFPDQVDLTTTYLGLQLKNPLVASASLDDERDGHERRWRQGWAGERRRSAVPGRGAGRAVGPHVRG